MSIPPHDQSLPPSLPHPERPSPEGALHLSSAYQRLLDSHYPLSVSPNAFSNAPPTHYTPYQPASASPLSPFVPLPPAPLDHSGHLFGSVESALWTGDLPSLGGGGGEDLASGGIADFPAPYPTFPGPSTFSHTLNPSDPYLSSALTVGQTLAAFPSATGSSAPAPSRTAPPAVGTLAARRGSAGGFETDHLVGAPTGMQSRVKLFIQKLSHLLSRPDMYADCMSWDSAGTAFVIHHCRRLHSEILPRMFSHSNSASLTRQLNVYGFRRLTSTELSSRIDVVDTHGYSGWIHDGFRKGDKASLHLLVPRPSRARLAKKEEKEQLEMERGMRTRGRQQQGLDDGDEDGEEAEEEVADPSFEGRRDSEASTSSSGGSSLITPTSSVPALTPLYQQNGGEYSYFDSAWMSK
ncbi:hypothetical protein JCM6882_007889 [Rhodosporidiobolus microsporus]